MAGTIQEPGPAPRETATRGPVLLAALLIVACAWVAYGNSLRVPLIYDDSGSIAQNPSIRHLSTALTPPPGGMPVSGRPVVNLSFAVNYALGGLDVRGYHAVNLLIHVLAGLALFGIVRRTVRLEQPKSVCFALAVALVWIAHPLQTESVTYLSQRAESLMGLFYLVTMYCFIRYTGDGIPGPVLPGQTRSGPTSCVPRSGTSEGEQAGRRPWAWLSVGACLLGMGSKEVMVTAPVVILLYDRTFVAGSFAGALRSRKGYYAALAAAWIPLAALVAASGSRGGTAGFGGVMPWTTYALIQFHAIAHYLRLAFWPSPLVFCYARTPGHPGGWLAVDIAVVAGVVAVAALGLRRRTPLGFLASAFLIVLAPSSSVVPVATETIAEHRMYLPLAAVVAAAAWAAARAIGRLQGSRARVAGTALLTFVVFLCAETTAGRNRDYRSDLALWRDAVGKTPDNADARNNLGYALLQQGDVAGALAQCEEALRLDPANGKAHSNYADALMRTGRADEAIAQYGRALGLIPGDAETLNNLGLALAGAGRVDEAIRCYDEALAKRPYLPEIHNNRGIALARAGRAGEAVSAFQRSLLLRPDYTEAEYNLGNALAGLGRLPEAADHFGRALTLRPDFADASEKLGEALVRMGHMPGALARFGEALRLHPDYLEARVNLGMALAQMGRADAAAEQFQAACRLQPADPVLHNNLGCALAQAGRIAEARRAFEEALRLKPDDADARSNLARLPGAR